MGKQASRFTLRDVSRALRAAAAAGIVARVDILPSGILSLVPIQAAPNQPGPETNSADEIIAKLK
jgi:hypothetical protein